MLLYRLEQESYEEPTRYHLLQQAVCKKSTDSPYPDTTTNPSNSFYIIPIYFLLKRKGCSSLPRQASIQTELFFGVRGAPNQSRYFGRSTQEPRGIGATCHLAQAVLQPGHTPHQQGCSAEFRVTRHSSDSKSQHFNSKTSGSTQVSSAPFITASVLSLSHFYIYCFFMFHRLHLNTGLPTPS